MKVQYVRNLIELKGAEGCYEARTNTIMVDSALSTLWKPFVFFHELGHWWFTLLLCRYRFCKIAWETGFVEGCTPYFTNSEGDEEFDRKKACNRVCVRLRLLNLIWDLWWKFLRDLYGLTRWRLANLRATSSEK